MLKRTVRLCFLIHHNVFLILRKVYSKHHLLQLIISILRILFSFVHFVRTTEDTLFL